jgi:hypothetical protein
MNVLNECDRILSDAHAADGADAALKAKARRMLQVLSASTRRLCELTASSPDTPEARFDAVTGADAVLRGADAVLRVLKQADVDAEAFMGACKQLQGVKKGAFRDLLADISTEIYVDRPVASAVLPALRDVVSALTDMYALCA